MPPFAPNCRLAILARWAMPKPPLRLPTGPMITNWISISWPLLVLLLVPGVPRSSNERSKYRVEPYSVLRRLLLQEERVPFTAEQDVMVSVGTDSDATVSREIHAGGRRCKIEYFMPKSAAGRQIVDNGKLRWEFDPV